MAFGAWSVATAWRMLRGLDDLVRPDAAGADADAARGPGDERFHALQVRLEPARADVMRVAHFTAHDGHFSADFTSLGHEFLSWPGPWAARQTLIIAHGCVSCKKDR